MTPADVTAYLDALRAGRCMSAELVLPTMTIRAVFAPDLEQPDAGTPWPVWKAEESK